MTTIINRTCTELPSDDDARGAGPVSVPLSDFRSVSAYVLLGDPGLGKSTAFRTEHDAQQDTAVLLDARDVLAAEPGSHQEWRGKTLYIDGLDEVRVGASDARSSLDRIRRRLDALGRPRFRISCREADWLGDNDRNRLGSTSQTSEITVLRLDPLSDDDIRQMLLNHSGVSDPGAFIDQARRRGLGDLLTNPQTLIMLADVVGGGKRWPESRLDTFGMACEVMASERNEEHKLGVQQPPLDELLDAAGYLCAAQLITGSPGVSLDSDDSSYLALRDLDAMIEGGAKAAVSTRLFRSVDERRFAPIHRHVAEFLGARYLARRIANGLSERRIVSLISGVDGIVVSEMRGLSGWLAALCPVTRDLLTARDPVGVALYGDLSGFETREKRWLLEALGDRDALFRVRTDNRALERETMLAPLIATDMETSLIEIMSRSSRDDADQHLVLYVLRLLSRARPRGSLIPLLLGMTTDESRWPYVRASALDALIQSKTAPEQGTDDLKALLEQVQAGSVADPDGELTGRLLSYLYPREIRAPQLWDYLAGRTDAQSYGSESHFWKHEILERSSDQDATELLEQLTVRHSEIWSALISHHAGAIPGHLLARVLESRGDDLSLARLHEWLSAAAPPLQELWNGRSVEGDSVADVRHWLERRPEIQRALVLHGLSRSPDGQRTIESENAVWAPLHGSALPADFGPWCLEQAVRWAPSRPQVAEFLLDEAFTAYRSGDISLDLLNSKVAGCKPLAEHLSARVEQVSQAQRRPASEKRAAWEAKHEAERQRGIEYVRGQAAALRRNEAPLSLLHDLARVYFRHMVSPAKPQEPIDRISDSLGADDELVQAALSGLRDSPWRSELPPPEEIIQISRRSRQHFLAYPVQAGLDLLHQHNPERLQELSDRQVATVLACYYCSPGSFSNSPPWHRVLAARRPELVAEVGTAVAVAELRANGGYSTSVNALVDMDEHPDLRHDALLEVLSKFPPRARLESLRTLDFLIWNVLGYSDSKPLLQLIETKLANTSMGVAQRIHWLAAGVMAAPDRYPEQMARYVRGGQRRVRQLTEFFDAELPRVLDGAEFAAATLSVLIELMGPAFAPDSLYESGVLTLEMKASRQIERFIRQLSALPGTDAAQGLARLLDDPSLRRWSAHLERARDDQRVLQRETTYSYPDLETLHRVLSDEDPANAGDLVALVIDRLDRIASDIRTSNANVWRQYWNEGLRGRQSEPKHEDYCRDALLAHLKLLLPRDVDAQPEGQYVRNRRSDIRVSYSDFNIPVEIKKVSHRDLWSAMRTQLIGKYTRDPDTSGFGIYLVLWFAGADMTPPPEGTRPTTPSELQERLTQTLASDEALKIEVVVIDVSQPT